MIGSIILVAVGLCIGGIMWMRQRRWQAYAPPGSPGAIPPTTLALKAFAQGNACLAEGKFAEAIAAFHHVREIEPKHPHVAGRLAEVQRQQQAASATPPVSATL